FPRQACPAAAVRDDADPARAGGGVRYSERLRSAGLAGIPIQPAWSGMDLLPLRPERHSAGAYFFQYADGDAPLFTGAGKHSRGAASDCRPAWHARLVVLPLCRMAVAATPDCPGGRANLYALLRQLRDRAFSRRR